IAIERARFYERSAELGAERERNRLAREIHDTLAQGFSAIALQLETADAILEAGGDAARVHKAVQQALALARAHLDEARRSVLDLRAAPLEGRTLAAALAVLASETTARHAIRVGFSAIGASRPLPAAVESGLYRVAQEAIRNIVQHAATGAAQMTLTVTPARVTLTVEDAGRGFDSDQTPAQRFGLMGMNERLKLLGGALTIASAPGRGTRIEAT